MLMGHAQNENTLVVNSIQQMVRKPAHHLSTDTIVYRCTRERIGLAELNRTQRLGTKVCPKSLLLLLVVAHSSGYIALDLGMKRQSSHFAGAFK